jgi:hypothetical protein
MTITDEAHTAICAVIDRVKLDDRNLDTDEYAGMIIDGLRGVLPKPEYHDEVEMCRWCDGSNRQVSEDRLCAECVAEGVEHCHNCDMYDDQVSAAYGMRMCRSCQHNAKRSGA